VLPSRESLQAQLCAEQAATARANPRAPDGLARRAEDLLARESRAPRVAIPAAMAALANEIRTANARAYAVGVSPPFTAEVLMALSTLSVRSAINRLREAGVFQEGRQWAVREATRPAIAAPIQQLAALLHGQARDLDR
jgi:hypothetical protein